ncbi:protein tyrosine phosphatase [Chromobacterium phragmitis]|uniref:low molecular weight protein-tyrosine-phosphatase n=1 Tax=Chromobacterium phragmitis TaxID=2202141 RepID=UPI000DED11CE|nr:low molecular weight protein-tyrosine-phosphatase [Chromobacterium phragmitis]AXE28557.1 protein tyrosine phosphatase [Chromobacterium phragmitis]
MIEKDVFSILFVCHGNICRSPTAEGVMRGKLAHRGWQARFRIDSAGTHGYHVGEAPDARSARAAAGRGYDLSALRARKVEDADFSGFDLILAADCHNLADLHRRCPPEMAGRLRLMLEPLGEGREVPDPYYGGERGFEQVLDLLEAACDAWLFRLGEDPHRGPADRTPLAC